MNIRIRIFSIGLFNDRSIQKKNDWEKNEIIIHLRLSLSLLFGRIDAALTLLVTSVLLLTSTLTIGKTTVVTMAAMVTRLVWSKYDPTYNRVRWVLFCWKCA